MRESNFFTKKLECCCIKSGKPCLQPKDCDKIFLDDPPNSSELLIDNPKRLKFYKVKVDGCLFKRGGPGKRCDWAVYSESCDRLVLFELKKSSRLGRGADQLAATADFFGQPSKTLCILVYKSSNAQKVISALEERNLIAKSIRVSNISTVHDSQDFIELLKYGMPESRSQRA